MHEIIFIPEDNNHAIIILTITPLLALIKPKHMNKKHGFLTYIRNNCDLYEQLAQTISVNILIWS